MRALALAGLLALLPWTSALAADALPDLVVFGLAAHPAEPAPGDLVAFTATVQNLGPGSSGPSVLMICITELGFLSEVHVPALAPGEAYTATSATWRATGRVQLAQAFADYNSDVDEAEETNNADELWVDLAPGPDLRIEALATSPEQPTHGSWTTFRAVVRNAGGAAAAASSVTFRLDGEPLEEVPLPALAAGQEAVVETSGTTMRAGFHVVRAEADEADALGEEDEGNNAAQLLLDIATPPLLDVQPTGPARGSFAVSGTGPATGTVAVSLAGDSEGALAVSLLGCARGETAVAACSLAP